MSGAQLAHIVRHPIKSVGFQTLERTTLTEGRALDHDRHWAITTQGTPFDGAPEGWMPKMAFVRGAAAGTLQAIHAGFDAATGHIDLSHPDLPPFSGVLPSDGAALVDWLRPLWPASRPAPRALVCRQDGGALTDVPEPHVAVLNLASLRALSRHMGQNLSIHRWRGNLWLDGLEPWHEFDLIGREIAIGGARLRIEARITRCVATTYDPETGQQDADTLAALDQGWGHRDFGTYARVLQSGPIAIGDSARILP